MDEVMETFRRVEVLHDGRVVTSTFMDAVECFLKIFDIVGGAFFTELVRSDMRNNMEKIHRACEKACVRTLQDMVSAEQATREEFEGSGTEALLWLKRTLQFILVLFSYMLTDDDDTPLSASAARAYEETVKPCHNWLLRNLFDAGLQCLPSRDDVYAELIAASIPCDGKATNVATEAKRTLRILQNALADLLSSIVQFYNTNALEDVCVVSLDSWRHDRQAQHPLQSAT